MEADGKRLRILVAEDSEIERVEINGMLVSAGFETVSVEDGYDAIELLRNKSECFDAIATDIFMPRASGLEVAKHNFRYCHLPLVAFTGKGDVLMALDVLRFGVKDFLLKPLSKNRFVNIINNAITRSKIFSNSAIDEEKFDGNIGSISMESKLDELHHANSWIRQMLSGKVGDDELQIFISYIFEFISNAYEHGNLGLGEKKKCELMDRGNYEEALKELESSVDAKIDVQLSILGEKFTIDIADQGEGFDYQRYLEMSNDEVIERIEMPNGRGIFMSKNYFDSIDYSNNGASVTLVKKIVSS